jgi:effector-binding domain-containing protein
MAEYTVREYGPVTVASLAMRGAFDQIPGAMGRLYGWLQAKGHRPEGMPVTVYLNDPAEVQPADALWEVWAPIEQDAEARDPDAEGLAIKRIPAMTVATTMHQGPYDQIGAAYERLMTWIAGQSLQMAGAPMEAYLNEPDEVPPEEYLTEVMLPVRYTS